MFRISRIWPAVAAVLAVLSLDTPAAHAYTPFSASATVYTNLGRWCGISVQGHTGTAGIAGLDKYVSFSATVTCNTPSNAYPRLLSASASGRITDSSGVSWGGGVGASCQTSYDGCSANDGYYQHLHPGPARYEVSANYVLWARTASGEVWTTFPDDSSYNNRFGCRPRPADPSYLSCYISKNGDV